MKIYKLSKLVLTKLSCKLSSLNYIFASCC